MSKTSVAVEQIPLVDLKAQQRQVQEKVDAGLAHIFENTAFIGGAAAQDFERPYA